MKFILNKKIIYISFAVIVISLAIILSIYFVLYYNPGYNPVQVLPQNQDPGPIINQLDYFIGINSSMIPNQNSITNSNTIIYQHPIAPTKQFWIYEDNILIKNNYGYITFGDNQFRKIINASKTSDNNNVYFTLTLDSKITVAQTYFFINNNEYHNCLLIYGGPNKCPYNIDGPDCSVTRTILGSNNVQIFIK